ncbi:MAG: TIGR00268 family protein, partial [Candidatus Firestonebacteria bacterium]
WDKPSLACLSSRIPYGIKLEKKTLKMVGAAEDFIRGLGFRQLRVRHHKTVARIEVMPQDISRILALKEKIAEKLKKLGYTYVTVDLEGFRSGSMNLVHLKAGKK